MRLSMREQDLLLLQHAGSLAQRRLARGLRLNHPEAVALIASQVLEFIRDGDKSVSDLMDAGRQLLGTRQVMPGVAELVGEVQVEGTFPDGTKLVTIHSPICLENGNLQLALHGSFLPAPALTQFAAADDGSVPKEWTIAALGSGTITLNAGRKQVDLDVTNLADRPIQVGSHYHFIETNRYLAFDRQRSYGLRLNIPSGTAVRFEPGETKTVVLTEIAGKKVIRGGNGICDGPVDSANLPTIMKKLEAQGFNHKPQGTTKEPGAKRQKQEKHGEDVGMMTKEAYMNMFGPTVGDMVRLGDTSLIVKVEKDFAVYGDECKFGGGKVLREGMGQAAGVDSQQALETIITNALVIDAVGGIYKADIGLKGGLIAGIGKGGNPDTMEGVDSNMIVGVNTEVIAGEGCILTAGGIDTHIHFICPQIATEEHVKMMLQATDGVPINFGFTGKGNTAKPEGLTDVVRAGAVGLKLHEDWGTTPAAIDTCLGVAESMDVQVTLHTDTLNESACVEHTIAAFKGRTIHSYHTEGAGGGHAPDIISVCGEPNVIPSSTNPTRPFTKNTIDEHLDMLMVCHHLDPNTKEDIAFAESRIRAETIAAEDRLHDLGAISIISSDSQAMGRVGETIGRTWQTASKMKSQFGPLPEDAAAAKGSGAGAGAGAGGASVSAPTVCDNFRVKRYIAKYTINPAVAHGMGHLIGSIEVGKLADLVMWKPEFFGAKPEMIVKGGVIAYSQMGHPNASIPTPEPVIMRPMFGAEGAAASACSVAFVSQECISSGVAKSYGLRKRVEAVKGCRKVGKKDMVHNATLPKVTVNPETYQVTADGEVLTCKPADKLPLAQRYFMF